MNLILSIASRNLRRNKRRTILTGFALTFGVWSAVTLASLARGVSNGMEKDALDKLTGHLQIHAAGYVDDPSVDYRFALSPSLKGKISTSGDVASWATRVRVPAVVVSERDSAGVTFVGIDPASEKELSFIGHSISEGRQLSSDSDEGIVLGKRMLSLIDTELGKRVVVMTQGKDGKVAERGFRVVGIFDTDLESTERAFVFTGRKVAQQMLGIGEEISEISVRLENGNRVDSVTKKLSEEFPNLDIKSWKRLEPLVVAIQKIQNGFLTLWFFVVVISVSVGLVNAMFMAVLERTREFGLVRALGMTGTKVLLMVLLEAIVLVIFSAILGNFLAAWTVHLLQGGIDISAFARGAEIAGIRSVVYPVTIVRDVALANLFVVVIGSLGSLLPAIRASHVSPAQGLVNV